MLHMTSNAPRPRILVAFAGKRTGERWGYYADAVSDAGGDPVPFDATGHMRGAAFPPHDGLLTTGVVDIDPARYGEPRDPQTQRAVPERDEAEIALTCRALDERRPLLAICRGMQVFNVARRVAPRGSLLQHLEPREPHHGPKGTKDSGWHGVEVVPGTLLARIAGTGPLRVNSRHHQAITPQRLAHGLVACGRTDEGGIMVIEAIEVPEHPFALGVQWHPEREEMRGNPARQNASTVIFEAFIAACTAVRAST